MDKERLKLYLQYKKEAYELKERINNLKADMESLKSVNIDGMPKTKTVNDRIGALVVRLEQLKEEYIKKWEDVCFQLTEIENVINSLNNPIEKQLMRKRYIEGMHWEDICKDMHYSWRQIHNIHSRILKKIK